MAIDLCTGPTQYGITEILIFKVDSTTKVSKNQFIYLFVYSKQPIAVCYTSIAATTFSW